MGYADGFVYSLTKVPLYIYSFLFIAGEFGLAPFGDCILKMALFYSLRNRQVVGESLKEQAVCHVPGALSNHPHFEMTILVCLLCHFHFWFLSPKAVCR